jgi:hypothetical protein
MMIICVHTRQCRQIKISNLFETKFIYYYYLFFSLLLIEKKQQQQLFCILLLSILYNSI